MRTIWRLFDHDHDSWRGKAPVVGVGVDVVERVEVGGVDLESTLKMAVLHCLAFTGVVSDAVVCIILFVSYIVVHKKTFYSCYVSRSWPVSQRIAI